jgi:unsaturated rhamnogalacturonyl hydrolase
MGRRILVLNCVICVMALAMSGCGARTDKRARQDPTVEHAAGPSAAPGVSAAGVAVPQTREVEGVMRRVFAWQSGTLGSPEPDWIQAVFMIGVVSAYEATGDTTYLGAAMRWASATDWQLGPRDLHADDHAAGQVYLDLARLTGDTTRIGPTIAGLRTLITASESADRIWWWCDALFMAPPALTRAAVVTGDAAFADSLSGMWWDAADPLFDGEERLFHRDAAARDNRDGTAALSRDGNRAFWSRGNGWVLSGIARTLQFLPEDDAANTLLSRVYTMMAERVVELQGGDGLWRTSLLDPWENYPGETSGTALLCHALAWGVNEGLLDTDVYAPVVFRAWHGLAASVDRQGRLGWVQGVGRSPGLVSESGTAPYGSGALLLAGSEVLRLTERINAEKAGAASQ